MLTRFINIRNGKAMQAKSVGVSLRFVPAARNEGDSAPDKRTPWLHARICDLALTLAWPEAIIFGRPTMVAEKMRDKELAGC